MGLITKTDGENYDDFVKRAVGTPLWQAVKLADLQDNRGLSRIANVTTKDLDLVERYRWAVP